MSLRPLGWTAVVALTLTAGAVLAQPAPDTGLDAALKNLGKPSGATPPGATTAALPKAAPTTQAQPKAPPAAPAQPKTQPAAAATKAAAPASPPAAAPVVPVSAAAPAAAPAPQTALNDPPEDDSPRGAPKDDYLFVAWCEGVLATHMQLYPRVKPELDAIAIRWNTVDEDAKSYSEQQIAGREDIAKFERAMRAAEAASPRNIIPDGLIAMQLGIERWSELGTVDARNQALSWMMWELPERCTRIAGELETRSKMMAPLLRNNASVAIAPRAPNTPTPNIPAPIPTAPPPAAATKP